MVLTFFFLIFGCIGLCCCMRAFSGCGVWGYSLVVMHGLLMTVASLVAERRLQSAWASVIVTQGFSRCGACRVALKHMESSLARDQTCIGRFVSPALAGRFSTPGNRREVLLFLTFLKKIKME